MWPLSLSLSLSLQVSSRSVTLYSMPLMATARFSAALDLAVSAAALRSATLVTASEVASELAACSRIVAHGLALKAGCCMTAGIRRALLALGVVSPAPCHRFILNSHLLPALLLGQGLGAALTDLSVGLLLPLLGNVVDDTRVALALGYRRLGDGDLARGLGERSGDTVKTTADDLLGLALLAPDVGARIRVQRGAGLDRTQEGLLDLCLLGRLGELGNLNSQSCSRRCPTHGSRGGGAGEDLLGDLRVGDGEGALGERGSGRVPPGSCSLCCAGLGSASASQR